MIKLGIIGCGYRGMNFIKNIMGFDRARLLVACDVSPKAISNVKSRYPDVQLCLDAEEVLTNKQLDAIVIATEPESHFAFAKKAIINGKDVFVENPLTTSSRTAMSLIRLAEKHGRILMVGQKIEFSPIVIKGEQIINSQFGHIKFASFSRFNLGHRSRRVDVLWGLAPHDLSIMFKWFKKMPKGVSCFASSFMFSNDDMPDIAMIRLIFDSQMMVNIEVSWAFPLKIRKIVVIGEKRMMVVNEAVDEKIKVYDKEMELKSLSDLHKNKLVCPGDIVSPHVPTFDPLRKEMEHFIECIEQRKKPVTDGESGLRVVRVIEAAEKSYKKGGKVINL